MARGPSAAPTLIVLLALVAAACGSSAAACGSSATAVEPFLGTWQRISGGVADPGVTVTVAERGGEATVTFAGFPQGRVETVAASAEDGYLACDASTVTQIPPTGEPSSLSPRPESAGVSPASRTQVQLSLDEDGQLVVDVVLSDGTLEPIWICERVPTPAPVEP